jgi:hypothetical protein
MRHGQETPVNQLKKITVEEKYDAPVAFCNAPEAEVFFTTIPFQNIIKLHHSFETVAGRWNTLVSH